MIVSIVVTYNGAKWIDRCFGSLISSSLPTRILAIDNGSTDGTANIIREKYPDTEVIDAGGNLGFGKANNIGLRKVLKEKADYAFLLNQDAWIQPDTISKLVSIHNTNPEYGILSPLHISGDGINLDNSFTNYISGHSCPGLISDFIFGRGIKEVYETSFVNAAFWLVPWRTIEIVGGFDPLFFMYVEDNDYTQRVKNHGFKIGVCPSSIGYHDRSQDYKEINNWNVNRLFSSFVYEMKYSQDLLPPKSHFYKILFKLLINKLITNRDLEKRIGLIKLILSKYSLIKDHKEICKQTNPTFLNISRNNS